MSVAVKEAEMVVCKSTKIIDQVQHVHAAALLFEEWAKEERRTPDVDQFVKDLTAGMMDGRSCLVVVYCDGVPAGMVTVVFGYDTQNSERWGSGERMYIRPEYRGGRVMRALYEACEEIGDLVGVNYSMAQCRAGSKLQAWWERRGYVLSHLTFKRREDGKD